MAVRIRLARMGKKKAPMYRIVAIDKRNKRDGAFLENLGTYNPLSGELVQFHAEKLSLTRLQCQLNFYCFCLSGFYYKQRNSRF